MAKEIVAMILAGGRGSRLYALTQKTAKPAVSFGGKYRIVDFPLSNCVNSSIDTVGIATQYQPQKLNEYIGNGQPWDLDRLYGGVHTLPPYEQAKGTDWYKMCIRDSTGRSDGLLWVFSSVGFINSSSPHRPHGQRCAFYSLILKNFVGFFKGFLGKYTIIFSLIFFLYIQHL